MTTPGSTRRRKELLSAAEERFGESAVRIEDYLRRHHLRATAGRVATVIALDHAEDENPAAVPHLSVLDLIAKVDAFGIQVEPTTVYRAVATLAEIGAIHSVQIAGQAALYGLDEPAHDHAVCIRCGALRSLPTSPPAAHTSAAGLTNWVFPNAGVLTLHGICGGCNGRLPSRSAEMTSAAGVS